MGSYVAFDKDRKSHEHECISLFMGTSDVLQFAI